VGLVCCVAVDRRQALKIELLRQLKFLCVYLFILCENQESELLLEPVKQVGKFSGRMLVFLGDFTSTAIFIDPPCSGIAP
jgi:hypothetical protein